MTTTSFAARLERKVRGDIKYVDILDRSFLREIATLLRDNEYALVVEKLGIDAEERERIENEYFPALEQRFQMLLLWKERSTEKSKVDQLMRALHAADVVEAVERLKTVTAPETNTADAEAEEDALSDDDLFSISTLLDPKYYFSLGAKLGVSSRTLVKLEKSPIITKNFKMMALLQCWRDTTVDNTAQALMRALADLRLPCLCTAEKVADVLKNQPDSPILPKRDTGTPRSTSSSPS